MPGVTPHPAVPFGTEGFEHTPVDGSHVPATWHWSLRRAGRRDCARCRCPPGTCRSACRRCRRCTRCRSAAAGLEHAPVDGLQVPATWHWSTRGAGDRVRARARARLAGVGLRARVAVVARGAVRRGGVGARARRRVARARDVALVARGARHGVRARARAGLAGVGLRARVAVVAGRAVRSRRGSSTRPSPGCTCRRRGTGRTRVQVTGLRPVHAPAWHVSVCVHALPSLHAVPFVAAGFEHAPVAGLHVPATWHWSIAVHVDRVRAGAGARLARVGLRARVAVVAASATRRRTGARGSGHVACLALAAGRRRRVAANAVHTHAGRALPRRRARPPRTAQ